MTGLTVAEQTQQFIVTVIGEYVGKTNSIPFTVTLPDGTKEIQYYDVFASGLGSLDFEWFLRLLIMGGTIVVSYHFLRWCLGILFTNKKFRL